MLKYCVVVWILYPPASAGHVPSCTVVSMLVWPELISDWYVWTDSSNSWTSSVHDFLYSYRPIVEICHNVDHIVFNVSTSSPRKYLQCYWDFRILTVCNYWHVLAGKGFLNEHTLNYKYQHLDNIGIFLYNTVLKKIKNEYQFQFPFTSEFSSMVTQTL